jgi:thermitase
MGIVGLNSDNSLGFAGVDFHCKLMVLKVLNSQNFGNFSWFTEGVYYAVDNGANVINLSLGGSSPSLAFDEAIQYALNEGVVVVACMMNENNSVSYYPAAYPGVIAVGATNPNDTRANPFFWSSTSGSCFGNHISVRAPGNFIYGLNFNSNTNYNSYWGGTSQAAPHVAGLAALLLAQDESRTPAQIKQIIEETSIDEVGSPLEDAEGFDIYHGHGRVNAYLALTYGITGSYLNSATPSWDIFPNPSSGRFRIRPPNKARLIELMDVNGRLVTRTEVSAHSSIDLMLETTGVYVVKVIGDDFVQAKRLIIN